MDFPKKNNVSECGMVFFCLKFLNERTFSLQVELELELEPIRPSGLNPSTEGSPKFQTKQKGSPISGSRCSRYMGVEPKIGGFPPKMDGENNGKPY